jgi:hypothetical protein
MEQARLEGVEGGVGAEVVMYGRKGGEDLGCGLAGRAEGRRVTSLVISVVEWQRVGL